MALCLKPFGEEVARGAQFFESENAPPSALEEFTDRCQRASSDLHRFARANPTAALGAGIAADARLRRTGCGKGPQLG